MALPTVQYTSLPDGGIHTIEDLMLALQGRLFAAGWTIAFANADAIGTGSAAAPAWDKAYTANTSMGEAIYVMPANGFSRQWYVRIDAAYGSSSANFVIRSQVGTGESSGTLVGAGTEYEYISASTSSAEVLIAASEDGLAMHFANTITATTFMVLIIERARTLAGVVEDDVIHQGFCATGTVSGLWADSACSRYRASDGFEYAVAPWAVLACTFDDFDTVAAPGAQPGFTSASGENGHAIGPYATSGQLAGVPRLACYMMPIDTVANTDHPIFVDGGVKLYRCPTDKPTTAWNVVVARE